MKPISAYFSEEFAEINTKNGKFLVLIMIKPELNKRKFGYSQHSKPDSLLRRKNLGFQLTPPAIGKMVDETVVIQGAQHSICYCRPGGSGDRDSVTVIKFVRACAENLGNGA